MKTAVVILNWNGKVLLEKFLPSVVKFSPEATVYVADNASSDDSVAFVSKGFPTVKIIQNKKNGGYAKGYNDALQGLTEDIFILLNSDVEVTPNWLQPILLHFQENPGTAVIQPKILDYKKRTHFEYAGAAGGYIDRLGYPYCRGRIFDTIEEDLGQYDDTTSIFWASGACLAIRRKVFEEVGKFDEDYFAHQEEIDLCWRIHCVGYQAMYIGDSEVLHLGGATLNNMHPRKTFLNFRNSLFNLLKNTHGISVFFLIFARLILDGFAALKFLAGRKPKHFTAIIQAHFSFYKNMPTVMKKKYDTCNNETYASLNSIVYKYYIEGKKKYIDL